MMDAYTDFAEIYDQCMDNVPYDEWCAYLVSLLQEYGVSEGIVAELGCGTGEVTIRLHDAGYDMIGIDASYEMLNVAMDKCFDREISDILFLNQDMRDMELYGTVSAFVSVCDSMNYLLTKEDMRKTFRLVNNYLEKNGLFIFDLKTDWYYSHVLANQVRVEQLQDAVLIWDNQYDAAAHRNEYDLTIFRKTENELYERTCETHVQQAYTISEIKKLLEEAGMQFVGAWKALTKEPAEETAERIYIAAREGFQPGKCYENTEL